jgi:beta-lactamase superfamily II metal-dependent hydrolase
LGHVPGEAPLLKSREPTEDEESFDAETGVDETEVSPVTSLESLDLNELANAPFQEDRNRVNASSIALLVESGDRSIMIGAKAQSSVLEDSIVRLLRERSLQRLRLDVFVVPRGGSRSSVSKGLLGRIACNRYVISTNGAYFKHPHPETIARIILYGRTDPKAGVTLVFNYRSVSSAMWDSPALQKRYRYDVAYPDTRAGGVTVRV